MAMLRTIVALTAGAAIMAPAVLVELADDRGGIGEVGSIGVVLSGTVSLPRSRSPEP